MSMGVFLRPSRKVKGKSVVDDRGVVIDSQCMAMQCGQCTSREVTITDVKLSQNVHWCIVVT